MTDLMWLSYWKPSGSISLHSPAVTNPKKFNDAHFLNLEARRKWAEYFLLCVCAAKNNFFGTSSTYFHNLIIN